MPRLSKDKWAEVRLEWEGEPTATFFGLADKYGVDRASISRAAAREGWSKRGVIADINEAAQRRADARCDSDGNATQRQRNAGDLATRDESERLRAEVLTRHRSEWAEMVAFRKTALVVMQEAHKKKDRASWANAKLAADTALANLRALAVAHDGERKAWGLDAKSEEDIVITNPRRALD